MIKKTICIKDYQDRTSTGDTWGTLTGITEGDIFHTSYESIYSTGNRSSLINVTQFDATGALLNYDATVLVNGNKDADGGYMNGDVTNCWIKFDFLIPKLINEAKLYLFTSNSTLGLWIWQGSNDDSTWHNIGDNFTLGIVQWEVIQILTTLSNNTNYFRYYRLLGISGSAGVGPYESEMEFKINDDNVNSSIVYYTGQTTNAYLVKLPILLTQNIDDIGFYTALDILWAKNTVYYSGETVVYENNSYICESGHTSGNYFDENYWKITPIGETTGYTVTYTGETQINQFRRYGKKDTDVDLYNPTSNSGFTQQITTSNGMIMQLIGERMKENGFDYQNLYDYKFWVSGNTGTTITYSDIDAISSKISYETKGLTTGNTIDVPSVKLDYLIGVVNPPKINIDVFIDRGSNASFDRHIKLGEIKSLNDLESYSNGYYKIKED